ncbi:MAG TPA: hypothetical protein VM100_01255 [Longimicrobiales bacterium]|nr:hypothetical protein [Longimicrobiales bacterium]
MSDFESYPELPYRRLESTGALRLLIPAFIVIGLVSLVGAFMGDVDRAWRAYHFNWLYFTSIAQGAVVLAVVVSITRGVWSRPIRRLALSFVTYLPIAWLLAIPILLFGAKHIFPWVAYPDSIQPGKDAYLNVPFMTIRILGLFGILIALELYFAYLQLRPDVGLMKDRDPANYGRFTKNWQGQEIEESTSFRKLAKLGPIIAIAFAVTFGIMAWDFVMSLEPHWYSTMIGPYFFMGAFLGGVAWTVIVSVTYVLKGNAADIIEPVTLHDIAKLMFGLCVFWAYLFYSQYIVIWYGLLPIEQQWIDHRFGMPYQPIMAAVFACLFILPFFGLMGVAPKRKPQLLVTGATIVAVGLWLERYILVYPSLYIGGTNAPFGWQEVGVAFFFLGLLLLAITTFQRRFPIFQIWQPMSEIELLGVEPIDAQVTRPDEADLRR